MLDNDSVGDKAISNNNGDVIAFSLAALAASCPF